MTERLNARLCYGMVVSILLLLAGLLGFGVRAFESAAISYSVYFVALGIVLVILPVSFIRRRAMANAAAARRISAGRPIQVRPRVGPRRGERRRPLLPGQVRTFAFERRSKQVHAIHIEAVVSGMARG